MDKPILNETPAEIALKNPNARGFKFLLFNVSRLCNQRCPFCWTSEALILLKKQATLEAIEWFNEETIYAILGRFKERGGEVIAIMADGEPLIGVNYTFIKRLTKICGTFDLGMLIFTNGELLSEKTIKELGKINHKISYSISINAGEETSYDKLQGIKGAYKRVMANKSAWKEYNKNNPENKLNSVGLHTVISSNTTKAEMKIIEQLISELGNIPWTVTTMGVAGDARINEKIVPKNSKLIEELIKIYGTGPTAKNPVKHNCSYIVSEWHDKSMYGITMHPFNGGAIQACPYLSQFGSSKWFSLKNYIEKFNSLDMKPDIAKWLDYAVLIDAIITTGAFKVVGYDHCLMRHKRVREIELFLAALNLEIEQRINGNYQNATNYFIDMTKLVNEAVTHISEYRFGMSVKLDIEKIKRTIGLEDLPIVD